MKSGYRYLRFLLGWLLTGLLPHAPVSAARVFYAVSTGDIYYVDIDGHDIFTTPTVGTPQLLHSAAATGAANLRSMALNVQDGTMFIGVAGSSGSGQIRELPLTSPNQFSLLPHGTTLAVPTAIALRYVPGTSDRRLYVVDARERIPAEAERSVPGRSRVPQESTLAVDGNAQIFEFRLSPGAPTSITSTSTLFTAPSPYDWPFGLALGPADEYLYWSDVGDGPFGFQLIRQALPEGSPEPFVEDFGTVLDRDPLTNQLVLAAEGETNGEIHRIPVNSEPSPQAIVGNLQEPHAVSMDPASGLVYLLEPGSLARYRLNDGTAQTGLVTGLSTALDESVVLAVAPSAASLKVTAGPPSTVAAGTPFNLGVELLDADGLRAMDKLTLNLAREPYGQELRQRDRAILTGIPHSVEYEDLGATVVPGLTVTEPGLYHYRIDVQGRPGPSTYSAPFQVVPGHADPDETGIEADDEVAAGTPFTAVLYIRDAYGNPRSAGGDNVTGSVTSGPNQGATLTSVDNEDGTYELTYTPTIAGTDQVTFQVDGQTIGENPYQVTVHAGPVSANSSTATVPAGVVDQPTTIQVQARDSYGNPVAQGGAVVAGSVSGANNGAQVTVTDNSNGTYTLVYTPTSTGADSIAISLGGTPIQGSPFTSVVSAGPPSPNTSTAAVPAGIAGQVTSITVTLRDAGNHPVSKGGASVAGTVGGANAGKAVASQDNGNGTYTLTYTPTLTGIDQIAITLNSTPISGSPYSSNVNPGAPSAPQSTATVPNGTAGQITTSSLIVRDAQGNSVGSGGHTVNATVSGANAGATVTVQDEGNGTYTLSYTPTKAGADSIAVTLSGQPVGGSPYASNVVAGPTSAAQTTATVPNGTVGAVTTIVIRPRDANGNPTAPGGSAFSIAVSGANTAAPQAVAAPDGSYTASYVPAASGTDQVAITVSGTPLAGSPFTSQISPGAPSAAQTTATVPNGTAGAATTIAVQVRDAKGNPRQTGGDTVTVTVSGANSASATVTDHGNGTYTATYTPQKAGTDSVAIQLGGQPIGGSPYSSVVQAAAAAKLAFVQQPLTTVAGEALPPVVVELRDSLGNRTAATTPVTLTLQNGGGATLGGTTTVSAVDGRATFSDLSIAQSGTGYRLNAAAGSLTPALSDPFDIVAASADRLRFVSQPSATVAGQTLPAVQVEVLDSLGNRATAASQPITLALRDGSPLLGTVTATPQNGVATFSDLRIEIAAPDHRLAATSSNTAGAVSNTFAVTAAAPSAQSSVSASPAEAPADGQAAITVNVTATDAYGNPSQGTAVTVATEGSAPAGLTITQPSATDANGRTQATITSTAAGTFTLVVTAGGTTLATRPVITFRAGAPGSGSTVTAAPDTAPADGSSAIGVTVRLVDANGNPVAGRTIVIGTTGPAPGGLTITQPVSPTDADGRASGSLRSTSAGSFTLAVTADGAPLAAQPMVTFTAGPVSSTESSFTSDRTDVLADGSSPVRFTVTVRDENGNPLAGRSDVAVNSSLASVTVTAVDTATRADGSVRFQATGTTVGQAVFTATVSGTALARTITVDFRRPPLNVDAGRTEVLLAPDSIANDGIDTAVLTVIVRTFEGEPVAGVLPSDRDLRSSGPGNVQVIDDGVTTGADGTYTVRLTTPDAGLYELTPVIAGVAVGPVHLSAGSAIPFSLAAGQHFVGFPLVPTADNLAELLAQPGVELARFDAVSQSYVRIVGGTTRRVILEELPAIPIGTGLWLRTSQPLQHVLRGEPLPAGRVRIRLRSGWNAVGNPSTLPVHWTLSQIGVEVAGQSVGTLATTGLWANTVLPYGWTYRDGFGYQLLFDPTQPGFGDVAGSLPAFRGVWIRALRDDVALVFDPENGAPARARAAASPNDWIASLTATTGAGQATARFGVAESLTRSLSLLAPPPAGDAAVEVRVIEPDGQRSVGRIESGAAGSWSWDIEVASRAADEVLLSWPSLLRQLPRGIVVELEDLQTGERRLLNTSAAYRYAGQSQRRFRVTATRGTVSRTSITGLTVQPTRGDGTALTLTLTGPAEIDLMVRGLGGQMVKQLTTTAGGAGTVTLVWDATDQSGRRVPRGTYTVEATARSANGASQRVVRTVVLR